MRMDCLIEDKLTLVGYEAQRNVVSNNKGYPRMMTDIRERRLSMQKMNGSQNKKCDFGDLQEREAFLITKRGSCSQQSQSEYCTSRSP